jgi:bleomycin hydrolase
MKSILILISVLFAHVASAQFVSSIYFNVEKSCNTTEVKNQGRTGTCWSFSATSFLESEMLRQNNEVVDLSEMFTVRNIYLEKAENYVRRHGTVNFSQGSLAHDVYRAHSSYGAMPEEVYSGKKTDMHNHSEMEKEMKNYLDTLLAHRPIDANWQDGLTAIMDKHLGESPEEFEYKGKLYSPMTFSKEVVNLNMDEFIGITSFSHHPYYSKFAVEIPDNFSNGKYYNVPIGELMKTVDHALHNGYSIEWDGDVSEKGFMPREGIALLLGDSTVFDSLPNIPAQVKVSQKNRQEAFDQQQTTDDHLMHITGLAHGPDGRHYFVVKNSWGTKLSFNGYLMMSEEYFAMKTVSIYLHKDGIPQSTKNNLLIR